jgi:hypothetical protein
MANAASWLTNLGTNFKTFIGKLLSIQTKLQPIEQEAASLISVADPAVGGIFEGALAIAGQVEQVATAVNASTGTGAQKFAAALPQVEQAFLSSPLFAGKTITNETLWQTAINGLLQSVVDASNAVAAPTTATAAAA